MMVTKYTNRSCKNVGEERQHCILVLPPTSKVADLRNVSSAENVCLSYFCSLLHVELSSPVLGRLIFERNEDADAPSD